MSAVSSESPRASADLNVQLADRVQPPAPDETVGSGAPSDGSNGSDGHDGRHGGTDFGPNQWLVDELYQRYQADPSSVDRAWWNFFADYQPKPAESVVPSSPATLVGLAPATAPAALAPAPVTSVP